jgi:protein-tyrosine phosphatase
MEISNIKKQYSNKLHTKYTLAVLIVLSSIFFFSCSKSSDNEPELEPGQSLGIVSIPNLRDMGGYKTTDGSTIARGLVYRSNQLYEISANDMLLLAELNLKNDFDLRRASERDEKPDELPMGVNNVWLDVLADLPPSGSSNLSELLADPQQANILLGDGKVEEMFKVAYRQCISLSSAQIAFSELFLSLGEKNKLPALFHCATGKDRTGWVAASFLTLMGVPEDVVMEDFLRSNDYILPLYETVIQEFVDAGGNPSITIALFGVKEEYLNAAFDEMNTKYGSIENYFTEALNISVDQQNTLRNLYLK